MDKNRYLIQLSEGPQTDFGRRDFSGQSHQQRVFSAIWMLEGEVNSGGFAHYLDSEDSEAPELIAFSTVALKAIGAFKCADIVDRALALSPQRDQPEVAQALDGLDAEFYAYPDNLTDLLYTYVAANPDVFGESPGDV